jgi:hypothetical protein
MNITPAFALFSLLVLGAPVYAESPCLECLKAAKDELKQCLANAISVEDKISCEEKQEAQAKECGDGECRIEREQSDTRNEVLPQTR